VQISGLLDLKGLDALEKKIAALRILLDTYIDANDTGRGMTEKKPTQLDKFKEAAREHEADEDEARWDERLGKLVKHKPQPEKPE